MRRIKAIFVITLLSATPLFGQQLKENTNEHLKVRYATPKVNFVAHGKDYVQLDLAGYHQGGEVGSPSLPVSTSLLAVPFCEGMEIRVENAVYDTLVLPEGQWWPLQPVHSKSILEIPFKQNAEVYSTDAFYGMPLASVELLGVGRDVNYAQLAFAPVQVNPVSGQVVVCRSADVTVTYQGADIARTEEHFQRYHTPAFSLGRTLNSLPSVKEVRADAPLRMVIVAAESLRCAALDEFAAWKRTQGLLVDTLYVPNGIAAATVANQLKAMYTEATDALPAPTYLLLVGDVAQLSAFNSKLSSSWTGPDNDHITDLYYVTWTSGDNLPDCYQGRFSATDTATVRSIVEKTLYYERYRFQEDSYLERAALIAGVDSYGHGTSHADPTMDYAAYHYINSDNGFNLVKYYKNDTASHPAGVTVTGSCQDRSTSSALKTFYNTGAGWINYSAHGNWNNWSDPSFYVSDANKMTNYDMPSVMIGNCCLSNKFNEGVCLGEALLRKGDRAGAVAYIGGTNSTYWDEDVYWSVGVRNRISSNMSLNYDANHRGMYDHLFHTNGEPQSECIATMGQVVMVGNMSVQNSGTDSDMKKYYWEIYELMGDPSLLPWLGRASNMTVTMTSNGSMLTVNAVPGAYVALVERGSLSFQAAAFAGTDGVATLPLPEVDLFSCFVSVTAQGYKPKIVSCNSSTVGIAEAAGQVVKVAPNPVVGRTTVEAQGLKRVAVMDLTGRTLMEVHAAADRCSLDLTAVPSGLWLLRIETASGTSVRKVVKN